MQEKWINAVKSSGIKKKQTKNRKKNIKRGRCCGFACWMRTSVLRVPLIDINGNFLGSETGVRLDHPGCHAQRVLFLTSCFWGCAITLLCKNIVGKRSDLVSPVSDLGQQEPHGKGCAEWGRWQNLEAERSQRRKIECISWQAFAVGVSSCNMLFSLCQLEFKLLGCGFFSWPVDLSVNTERQKHVKSCKSTYSNLCRSQVSL